MYIYIYIILTYTYIYIYTRIQYVDLYAYVDSVEGLHSKCVPENDGLMDLNIPLKY